MKEGFKSFSQLVFLPFGHVLWFEDKKTAVMLKWYSRIKWTCLMNPSHENLNIIYNTHNIINIRPIQSELWPLTADLCPLFIYTTAAKAANSTMKAMMQTCLRSLTVQIWSLMVSITKKLFHGRNPTFPAGSSLFWVPQSEWDPLITVKKKKRFAKTVQTKDTFPHLCHFVIETWQLSPGSHLKLEIHWCIQPKWLKWVTNPSH